MFRTKIDVDRHVENCLRKTQTELERNLRCFAFSKLYYNIGDYEQAHRYILSYLSVKTASADGQQMLGKILEKLGKKEAALTAYRTSLDIDPKQNHIVLKVCELMSNDDVNLDQSGARYFCELAQSFDPYNPVLFQLKARLVEVDSKDPNDVAQLLLKELETRPMDVNVRVRLLRHLLQNNKIKEAYNHAYEIEKKYLSIFLNSLSWYQTLAEVLICYQRENSLGTSLTWEYWMLLISVLDKLVALSLDERSGQVKSTTECVTAVFNFDQNLKIAADKIKSCPEKALVQEFLNHYTGQLCFHYMTLLFKYAKSESMKYKEAGQISLALLFAAFNFKPADLQSVWIEHSGEAYRSQIQRWNREASYRSSQVGHMLMAFAKDRKTAILERANQAVNGLWREKIFKKVFVTRDQQLKIKSSYFTLTELLVEFPIRLPDLSEVIKYDEVAQYVNPDSLHHYIWIGLNHQLPLFNLTVFEGLQYSIKNLGNCGAETLNILDIQSFIYCSILCAQSQLEDYKHTIYYNSEKPNVLPAPIIEMLGTNEQAKWLKSAYKMYTNQSGGDLGDVRLTLIRGIEVIRCVGNHGLDVKLLVALAKIFSERSNNLKKQSEIDFNDARAELYWKAALPLLEKLKKNQSFSSSSNKLFDYKMKDFNQNEIAQNIESGKLFTAIQLMKKKENEKALHIFETLKDPYASFHQAHIYKSMADKETLQNKENVTSEMRSQQIILFTRARDCFYLTLDRLRNMDRKHPLNEKLGTEIEKIERLLSKIDPDICNRNDCDEMSDENVSSIESENYVSAYHTSFTNGNYTRAENVHSTPYRLEKRDARPSPERLDAQLRQLAASKDAAINHILDQNKVMLESLKNLTEELKNFREAVSSLTTTNKSIKKSVDDLKVAVDDLQSIKNVSDVVSEMKKEISELKKDTSKIKSNQLSDEDLYVLDDEYGTDNCYYNMNSNVPALTPSIYPNIRAMPAGSTLPPGTAPLYHHGMYPMYSYPGLGIPQAGTLPFGAESQLDIRTMASLSLNQQGLNQPAYQPPSIQPLTQPLTIQPLTQPSHTAPPPTISTYQPMPQLQPKPTTNIFKETTSFPSATTSSYPLSVTSKAPPVNVVITASDPLPTTKTVTNQQVLSVTIPPQHLKANNQKAHNYQIALPPTTVAITPSVMNQTPMPVSTQTLLSNIAPPVYSALPDKSPTKNTSLGLQIEKSLSESFKTDLNKSNISCSSTEEHDPCPDFKPIIPLPDEVPVNTGEENETVLFCERAKLFRYVEKEWKERGIGEFKLLENPETGKVRVLMRREQVHKICANHYLMEDMILKAKSEKAYIWAAQDYADGKVVLETFCVQFKTPEIAKKFYSTFEKAKEMIGKKGVSVQIEKKQVPAKKTEEVKKTEAEEKKADLGGFKFTSTPTFKPKDDKEKVAVVTSEPIKTTPFASFKFTTKESEVAKPNLFSSFSFSSPNVENSKPSTTFSFTKDNTDSPFASVSLVKNVQQKEETTPKSKSLFGKDGKEDSKPLVFTNKDTSKITETNLVKPSPFVPVKQEDSKSEENADDFVPTVEFKPVIPLPDLVDVKTGEENAEILFESKAKLLRFDTTNKEWKERGVGQMKILKENTIRLLMRREQVHKVCCNHQLIKSIQFTRMKNSATAVSWCAKDYSEGVFTTEMFAIRFKTEEILNNFLDAIAKAQDMLDENGVVKGDDSKKSKAVEVVAKGWGDKFKPKSGNWECKNCYIINEQKVNYCVACETPKNNEVGKKEVENQFCFGAKAQNPTGFSFGVKKDEKKEPLVPVTVPQTFGDAFKPKPGSWECKECYTRNDAIKEKCASCEVSKDGSKPKTSSSNQGIDLSTGGLKFNFGVPKTSSTPTSSIPTTLSISTPTKAPEQIPKPVQGFGDAFKPKPGSWECKECYTRNETDYCLSCECPKDDTIPVKENKQNKGIDLSTGGLKFNFGMPATTNSSPFSFATKVAETKSFSFVPSSTPKVEEEYVFGSPHKAGFEFTPRSPRRQSSGQGHEDESENSYFEEEEDNIYFKPVIPLPDKVEVTTGEEDEVVLYCHRAKLFRHVDKEWKERGIGDLKILLNNKNNKLRVLMRREQVHKICLNHILNEEVKYTLKDDKTWLFCAADYSEGAIEYEKFCLRFKTPEIAQEFKKAVDDALTRPPNDCLNDEDDDDVEIVFETKVTAEEEAEAKRLGLPLKFMSYRQKPDCECKQCLKEAEEENMATRTPTSTTFNDSTFYTPNTSSVTSTATPTFSTLGEKEKKTDNLRDLLDKPSIFKTGGFTFASSGDANKSSSFSGNLFADPAPKPQNIFGSSPAVFGSSPAVFGSSPAVFGSSPTVFGGSPSIFGGSPSIGGNNPFGNKPSTTNASSFGFGNKDSNNVTSTTNVFGNISSTNSPAPTTTIQTDKLSTIFADTSNQPVKTNFLFSSMLSGVQQSSTFAKPTNNENPFASIGAGAAVFASVPKPDQKKESTEGGGENEEYDPHYEPIIALPEEIVVVTGEENETVLFNERGKLYRYSNKEWKERGVGEVKILHDPKTNYYRLLMRREVVHRIVLNQRITPDLDIQQYQKSANTWTWAGMNFIENETVCEQLALRLKSKTIADKFYDVVQNAIKNSTAAPVNTSTSDDECYEDDEEDTERSILFRRDCVLSEKSSNGQWLEIVKNGDMQIIYDPENCETRILVFDNSRCLVSDTLIGKNTIMKITPDDDGLDCEWRAVEHAVDIKVFKMLKASFDSSEEAQECFCAYQEGTSYAEQFNSVDEIP